MSIHFFGWCASTKYNTRTIYNITKYYTSAILFTLRSMSVELFPLQLLQSLFWEINGADMYPGHRFITEHKISIKSTQQNILLLQYISPRDLLSFDGNKSTFILFPCTSILILCLPACWCMQPWWSYRWLLRSFSQWQLSPSTS